MKQEEVVSSDPRPLHGGLRARLFHRNRACSSPLQAAAFSPVLVQQLRDYYYQRQQQDAAQPTPTPSSRHHPSAQAASAAVDASPLSLYYYSTPSNRDENRPPPQPSSPAPPTGSAALKALADVLPLLKQAAATSSLSAFKAAASLPRSRAADTRPIYDDDDSVAFSNLMPRWVANGAQGAVLPLQQRTPNKPLSSVAFGSGATPSGKGKSTPRRSKGWEGNAAARAATPLIDGRLADGADVLYPDVSPVRKQAPAAVFPRAGSAVKMRQKQDLRCVRARRGVAGQLGCEHWPFLLTLSMAHNTAFTLTH